jgi:hypothetical protein
MSALTWDQVIAEQQHRARVLSPERMRAEMLWQEITGKVSGLPPLPAIWWSPPAPAPAPRAPRGRGRRQAKPARVVSVEKKAGPRMLAMPDGRNVAGSRRTIRSTITV